MIQLTTPPAVEPVTLTEAKAHLNIDGTDLDSEVTLWIKSARQKVETITGPIITQTRTYYSNALSGVIDLEANVQSISSIKYIDSDGIQQVLAASEYRLNNKALIACVEPEYGKEWPAVRDVSNSVEIEFIAGYGLAADVPEPIKQAIKLQIGDHSEIREETIIGVSQSSSGQINMLLEDYKVHRA